MRFETNLRAKGCSSTFRASHWVQGLPLPKEV
jgi:hypothetical protein